MGEPITQRIASIEGVREYNGPRGTVFYFKLVMDDGSVGEMGRRSKDALHVGDSITYTVEDGRFGKNFKSVQQGGGYSGGGRSYGNGNNGGSRHSTAGMALAFAKDMCVAGIPLHPEKSPTDWVNTTLAIADKMLAWMKANES